MEATTAQAAIKIGVKRQSQRAAALRLRKIDMADAKHVQYWTKALDVSKEDLFEAIDKVGNAAATVRKELQRKGLVMSEDDKPLKPEDFPVNSEGKKIKKAGWHPDCGDLQTRL